MLISQRNVNFVGVSQVHMFLLYVPHLYLLNMSAYSWTSISSWCSCLLHCPLSIIILDFCNWNNLNVKLLYIVHYLFIYIRYNLHIESFKCWTKSRLKHYLMQHSRVKLLPDVANSSVPYSVHFFTIVDLCDK